MSGDLEIRIFGPILVVAIFFALSLGWARSLSSPLTLLQKQMLAFGTIAITGVGYLVLWQDELSSLTHMPNAYIAGCILWIIVSWFIVAQIHFTDPDDQNET
jgi:hypothetical protein